ncbi:MAG TPA: ATP-binding protein [Gammaproteobacteria bacterium]|nr:ATP-binding protein [Gammaproteobacteria bacterium]
MRLAKSVRGKLLVVVITTTAAALVLTGIAMTIYDVRSFRERRVAELTAQADILGLAAAAALEFEDPKSAQSYLEFLKVHPSVTQAAIYTAKGSLFSRYSAHGHEDAEFPTLAEVDGTVVDGNKLTLFKRIVANNEILGTVYLSAEYDLLGRLGDYAAILTTVLVASLAAALLMSGRLHKNVTGPIADITSVARHVIEKRDFALRASTKSDDEVGVLAAAFNSMLSEIDSRTKVLEDSNRRLQSEVEERERAQKARDSSQRRVRTLISALTQVVWVSDPRGRFVEQAEAWTAYTGQSFEEHREFGWRRAFDEDGRQALEIAWSKAVDEPAPFEAELKLWHAASGRHRYVALRAAPMRDQTGAVEEWIGAILDIEDQRTAERSLRTLNAELEQRVTLRTAQLEAANKDLEGFSYSVSHDLRAPIRAINGFCTLLMKDHEAQLDTEAQRKVAVIKSEAERMAALIDDLLAFSRLGRKALQPAEVDMRELAAGAYQRLVNGQAQRIEFRIGTLPRATADRSLLEQVWVNLLSNAIKFSGKKDAPVVEVGAISEEHEYVYFVRDNGAGFDPRYQDKLFGVFQRLHHGDEFPGTGVGLALVHRIVTRHGGRVWADARLGEGATFHFTLPKESGGGRV